MVAEVDAQATNGWQFRATDVLELHPANAPAQPASGVKLAWFCATYARDQGSSP